MPRAKVFLPSTPKRSRVRSSTSPREVLGSLQCPIWASVAKPLHVSKGEVQSSRGVGIGKENIPPQPFEVEAARPRVASRGRTLPSESPLTSKNMSCC